MATGEITAEQVKPKKSKWYLWACGGCGCLVLVIIIAASTLRIFGGSMLYGLFGADGPFGGQQSTSEDPEDQPMSKDELVNYFVELTTNYPIATGNMPIKVAKWNKLNIKVSIQDTPPDGGVNAVDKFIKTFNQNSTKTKLERVDKNGDIKIYFQSPTEDAAGRAGASTGADYIIDEVDVRLSERAAVFQQALDSILAHEMFHALGFTGHYSGSVCRLTSSATCGSHFTINEERVIQMLYRTDIPAGSGEPEIRAYFKNWSPV